MEKGVYKYIPKAVVEGKFTGFVKVKLLTFDEHYDFLEMYAGAGDDDDSLKGLKATRQLVAASKSHYLEVDLKRVSDGAEFKSFDDLAYGSDCHKILVDVATGLLGSFGEGNG